jgi:hypothetical protein
MKGQLYMVVYDRVSEQHQKMHAYIQSHVKKYKGQKLEYGQLPHDMTRVLGAYQLCPTQITITQN